jgi:hypothetical protein
MTASRNAQPLPIDADPWLWWQQLRSDLLAGSTIKGHQSPERIAVLAERRGDQWPLELELCEYYRDSRIGTGTVANCRDTITRVRQQLARMKTSRPVKEQLFDALPAINAGDATGPRPEQLSGKGVVVGFVGV